MRGDRRVYPPRHQSGEAYLTQIFGRELRRRGGGKVLAATCSGGGQSGSVLVEV